MLYKIYHNPRHPLNSELPDFFQPVRVTRYALRANSLAFAAVRHNTNQYERSFILATTRLWNELPSHVVESQELQRFKTGVNDFFRSRNLSNLCTVYIII